VAVKNRVKVYMKIELKFLVRRYWEGFGEVMREVKMVYNI
jgi:hypothetical protein